MINKLTRNYTKMQQPPKKNDSTPIVDLVIEDMLERKRIGIEQYGIPLQAYNQRNSAQDAYEEVLDMAAYMKQLLIERNDMIALLERFYKITDDNTLYLDVSILLKKLGRI